MIKISFVYKVLPVITIYTNKFIPERFSGYSVGFINFIRPNYFQDKGMYEHEKRHSQQFYRNPIEYCLGRWLKYFKFLPERVINWSKEKTFEYECEAYAVQLKYHNEKYFDFLLDVYSEYVITKYNLDNYTKEQAKDKILEYYNKL